MPSAEGIAGVPSQSHSRTKISPTEKLFCLIFLLSLPFVNPWVRGDGVGYYAYARAPLIQGNFDFSSDWKHGDEAFREAKLDASGNVQRGEFTRTGHVDNHFTVGPAILWMPFLAVGHAIVLAADHLGARIPADGFSSPYRIAMALGTAFYGFLGLWLSYRLARKYAPERWAAAATLCVWFGSSLVVYMYFNPSWSHAHSAFAVAVFLWYWDCTRGNRMLRQWAILGIVGGLMTDVYYPNALAMIAPLAELAVSVMGDGKIAHRVQGWRKQLAGCSLCGAGFLIALAPTFITRQIVYGSPFEAGSYTHWAWHWASPALFSVLFSADHGLFSWTPIVLLGVGGLFLLLRRNRLFGISLLAIFAAYLYVIASFPFWDGTSSFGNRFFISLTPIFVVGLALLLARAAAHIPRHLRRAPEIVLAALVIWNLGMVFQWGTHLIPARGPISWRQMAYNQVAVVPAEAGAMLARYFLNRKEMMRQIEQQDIKRSQKQDRPGP